MKYLILKKNERGQAAIEFILVSVVVFFFLLFFLSLSVLLVVGSYMDYATFMAARTYKASFRSQTEQNTNAEQVFSSYFEKVRGIVKSAVVEFGQLTSDPHTNGAQSFYTVDFFYLPPLFTGLVNSRITLSSEAFLGRDPSNQECEDFFTDFARKIGVNMDNRFTRQMEDNGC